MFVFSTQTHPMSLWGCLKPGHRRSGETNRLFSRVMNKAQRDYCTTRRELLAVISAMQHFRPILQRHRMSVFSTRTHPMSLWGCLKPGHRRSGETNRLLFPRHEQSPTRLLHNSPRASSSYLSLATLPALFAWNQSNPSERPS